jgi:preprotein translocase subunit SecB
MPQLPVPQIGVLMQYLKDFSFENPNAPRSLAPSTQQPRIGINIGVEAAPLAEADVEVTLRLEGKAESQGMLLFGFELLYAGVFRVLNVPPESMQPTVLIECPRLLFPFAREIIASATRIAVFRRCCLNRSILARFIASAWPPGRPHRQRRRSIQADVIAPDRVVAQCGDKFAVRRALLVSQAFGKRHRPFTQNDRLAGDMNRRRCLRENELRLARANQLDINLGQQLGIEQRAMLGAP